MATANPVWTDSDGIWTTGAQVGFLVRRVGHLRGDERYTLQLHPARNSGSGEARLRGWCGTTDDVSTHACGLARVSRAGARGMVQLVSVAATPEALAEIGYPDLG